MNNYTNQLGKQKMHNVWDLEFCWHVIMWCNYIIYEPPKNTVFRWGGKRLYFCTTNLLRMIYAKFYQNWSDFVEDMSDNILMYFLQYKELLHISWGCISLILLVMWFCAVSVVPLQAAVVQYHWSVCCEVERSDISTTKRAFERWPVN